MTPTTSSPATAAFTAETKKLASHAEDVPAHTVLLCDYGHGSMKPRQQLSGDDEKRRNTTRPVSQPSAGSSRRRARQQRPVSDYRKTQAAIYHFMERPRSCPAYFYYTVHILLLLVCFILTIVASASGDSSYAQEVLKWTEVAVVVWFGVEYLVHFWATGCSQCGNCFEEFVPDTIILVAYIVVVSIGQHGLVIFISLFRGLRFFDFLRVVGLNRRRDKWRLLLSVFRKYRTELLLSYFLGFTGWIFFSYVIYFNESNSRHSRHESMADAFAYGLSTFLTGKENRGILLSTGSSIAAGIGGWFVFFCVGLVPAVIIGSGLVLNVEEYRRRKPLIIRAAKLIQSAWRCYATNKRVSDTLALKATWDVHCTLVARMIEAERLRLQQDEGEMEEYQRVVPKFTASMEVMTHIVWLMKSLVAKRKFHAVRMSGPAANSSAGGADRLIQIRDLDQRMDQASVRDVATQRQSVEMERKLDKILLLFSQRDRHVAEQTVSSSQPDGVSQFNLEKTTTKFRA